MSEPCTITFEVEHPGEPAAGVRAYSETLTVTVHSGEPPAGLERVMLSVIRGLYDPAWVSIADRKEPAP